MKTVIMIDGGVGRVISTLPALEKYLRLNPNDNTTILVFGWDSFMWGNKKLQYITFNSDTKGIFEQFVYNCDKLLVPEPYRVPQYFRQEISLSDAIDKELNDTDIHTDLEKPTLYSNNQEDIVAQNIWNTCLSQQKKKKNVLIQPYGRAIKLDNGVLFDDSSRSLKHDDYIKTVQKLSTKYNLISMSEKFCFSSQDIFTFKPEVDPRYWIALIKQADYFIGCDSMGQHIAHAVGCPGTVILGSTFAINVSYPNWFQILEKPEVLRKYSPIRITGFDNHMADRYNSDCMNFSPKELNNIIEQIVEDVELKTK